MATETIAITTTGSPRLSSTRSPEQGQGPMIRNDVDSDGKDGDQESVISDGADTVATDGVVASWNSVFGNDRGGDEKDDGDSPLDIEFSIPTTTTDGPSLGRPIKVSGGQEEDMTAIKSRLDNFNASAAVDGDDEEDFSIRFSVHSTFRDRSSGKQVFPSGLQWGLGGVSHVTYVLLPNNGASTHDDKAQIMAEWIANALVDDVSVRSSNHHHQQQLKDRKLLVPQQDKLRHALIEAHNRWAFAKQLPLKHTSDIIAIQRLNGSPYHFQVQWAPSSSHHDSSASSKYSFKTRSRASLRDFISRKEIRELLQKEMEQRISSNAKNGKVDGQQGDFFSSIQVWMNGSFVATLEGPESLSKILHELESLPSKNLCYRTQEVHDDDDEQQQQQQQQQQQDSNDRDCHRRSYKIIRIERIFRGMLMDADVVFEHIMDNLLAMEDPKMIDEHTLIGTATLPDWIMGGQLTSRIWIQETNRSSSLSLSSSSATTTRTTKTENADRESNTDHYSIAFERPLYQDDISTSDRSFELHPSSATNIHKIALVQHELSRLREVARFEHPFETTAVGRKDGTTAIPAEDASTDSNFDADLDGLVRHHHVESQNQRDASNSNSNSNPTKKNESSNAMDKRRLQHQTNKKKFFGF